MPIRPTDPKMRGINLRSNSFYYDSNEEDCDDFFITEQKREEDIEKWECPLAKESEQFQAYVVHRQLVEHVNDEEKLIENEVLEEKAKEKAAILIQKTARGFLGRRKVIKLKQNVIKGALHETKQCRSDSSDSVDSTSTVSDYEYQQGLNSFNNSETKQGRTDSSVTTSKISDSKDCDPNSFTQFQFEEEYLNDDDQVNSLQQYQSREKKVA